MKQLFAIIAFILLFATAAFSQSGLKMGQQAPEFHGTDFTGKTVDLRQLLKRHKAVVLFFYRGLWCPYCNKYIQSMQDSLELLAQKGVYVVGVTPQTDANIQKTADRHHTSFSMVHDKDYTIMKAYDVDYKVGEEQMAAFRKYHVDLAQFNGNSDYVLPVPATYIISKTGRIVYVQFDKDYTHRASVAEILAEVQKAL
jgi:peroxiredoxin